MRRKTCWAQGATVTLGAVSRGSRWPSLDYVAQEVVAVGRLSRRLGAYERGCRGPRLPRVPPVPLPGPGQVAAHPFVTGSLPQPRLCLSCFPNLTLQCGNRASRRPTVRQLESGRTGIPASGAQDLRCHAGPTPNLSNSAALEGAGSFRVQRWSRTPAAQTTLIRVRAHAPGCPGNPF